MAIKKRSAARPKPKKRIKRSPEELAMTVRIKSLRTLVDSDDDEDIRKAMQEIIGVSCSGYVFVEMVCARFNTSIECTQPFHKDAKTHWRVFFKYEDRTAVPRYGYLYPTYMGLATSTRLVQAVILAYIQTCKNIGRFI